MRQLGTKVYLLNHPKLSMELQHGSEGPQYDPYSFQEIIVRTPQGRTVLHEGLGSWLKFNGKEVKRLPGQDYDAYERMLRDEAFPSCTGFTVTQLHRIARKLRSRCAQCGSRDFHYESGFPGETFEVCSRCNHIVSTSFNISAIE
jgi:hypothetical protein